MFSVTNQTSTCESEQEDDAVVKRLELELADYFVVSGAERFLLVSQAPAVLYPTLLHCQLAQAHCSLKHKQDYIIYARAVGLI